MYCTLVEKMTGSTETPRSKECRFQTESAAPLQYPLMIDTLGPVLDRSGRTDRSAARMIASGSGRRFSNLDSRPISGFESEQSEVGYGSILKSCSRPLARYVDFVESSSVDETGVSGCVVDVVANETSSLPLLFM